MKMMTEEERKVSRKAAQRKWKAKNREKIRTYDRERYRTIPAIRERIKKQASEWGKAHPEARNESSKRTYRKQALDPEKRSIMNARSKKYRDANIEKTHAYHREYNRRNKKAIRERKERTQTPQKGAARRAVTKALCQGVLERSDICMRCGNPAITEAHHYKGYDEIYHLDVEWLCKSCHMKATWVERRALMAC
jgi:hypothetical protein